MVFTLDISLVTRIIMLLTTMIDVAKIEETTSHISRDSMVIIKAIIMTTTEVAAVA